MPEVTEKTEELVMRLHCLSDQAIADYIGDLNRRYGKYLLPPEETRGVIDQSMGENRLSSILLSMRAEEP